MENRPYEPGMFPIATLGNTGRGTQIKNVSAKGWRDYSNNENFYNMSHGIGGVSSIAALFGNGEQGVYFDAGDMASMYQDSAGTTPAAIEQPVGKWLDKSGRGNHATQPTAGSRPTLKARYNTVFSAITNATWNKGRASTSVDGATLTNSGNVNPNEGIFFNNTAQPNGSWTVLMILRAGTLTAGRALLKDANTDTVRATLDFGNLTGFPQMLSFSGVTAGAAAGYRVEISTRGVTGTINIDGVDVRLTSDTLLNIPPFQQVNTATDYDTVGFPKYLYGGWMVTGNVDFSGTDEMTAIVGISKLTDATRSFVFLQAAAAQRIAIEAPSAALNDYAATSGGTVNVGVVSGAVAAPANTVVSEQGDISSPSVKIRLNGIEVNSNVASQGTGNYSNTPLNLFTSGAGALPFVGRTYTLVVRGAATNPLPLFMAEEEVGSKMGIELV